MQTNNALPTLMRWKLTVAMVLSLCALMPVHADSGNDWLLSQLQADGSYEGLNDIATSVQATAETMRLKYALDPAGYHANPYSLDFLDASTSQAVTEYLARDLIARAEAGYPTTDALATLEASQNPDGGFGGTPGFASSPLDTAFALEALIKTGSNNATAISATINYLRSRQNADGSYTQDNDGDGATYITATALMALHSSRLKFDLAQPIAKAANFLMSTQESIGGWGSDFETAWALLALAPATTDKAPLANAAQVLGNMQLPNGSWGQDVYRTALAIRALHGMKGGANPAPWNGTVVGYAVDQASGLPLGDVLVSAGNGLSISTAPDGGFILQGVPPGIHTVIFTLAGYNEVNRTVSLDAGQQDDLGTVGLSVLPDSSVVAGIVTDAETGNPLTGATISLNGNGGSAITDASGAYHLVAAPGSFTITASAPGFLDAGATAAFEAGTILTFSPGLITASKPPPTTTSLYGQVVDAKTGQDLSRVEVVVNGTALKTVTETDGSFSLGNLAPGAWELNLNLAGYRSTHVSLVVPAGASNLGTIRLFALNTTQVGDNIITGVVTDAAHSIPIAGAHITLTGSATVTVETNALGAYRMVVPSGIFTITASATGFKDAVASTTVSANTLLTFSPGLLADSVAAPTVANLTGTVVDASTGSVLSGVDVTVMGSPTSTVTDANGKFALADFAPGTWILDLNHPGYQGVRVTLTAPVGTSDLGTIRLSLTTTNGNSLVGIVTDSATGIPMVGAEIAIPSEGKITRTAADGTYRIEGIAQTKFIVSVSAVGYSSKQGEISLATAGTFTLNVNLDRAATTDFDIASLLPGQPGYLAHSKVEVQAQLSNSATTIRKVALYGVIEAADGQIVAQFPARSVPLGGDPSSALETVSAGGSTTTIVDWHNAAIAPGWYTFIVQAYDGASGQLLAERSSPIEILATQSIGGSVEFNPPIAQLAAQQPVSLSAMVNNRGNLDLPVGNITATVTLKNPGYQTGNALLETEVLAEGNGLNGPRGIDRDNSGNVYAVNNIANTLSRVNSAGTVTQVAAGFATPVDVDVASNGDVYVLNAANSYERLAADGSRQKVVTSLPGQQALEVLADGQIYIAVGSNGVYGISPAGNKTKLPITGLSNATEIQADAQGRIYIGDTTKGTIFRLVGGNVLEIAQTGLPSLETFTIAADNSFAAIYSSKKLALFAPDGIRRELTDALPATVRGSVWDADGKLVVSVDGTTDSLLKLHLSAPSDAISVGEVVHTSTLALPPLALGGVAIPLDFGSWVPTQSGDFQVEVTVDAHPEYGIVANTLHVGPNAYGDMTVAQSTVRPGNSPNMATISLFGADSTSVTRIDPDGTTLAASSKTNGRGIAADTQGNIYATNASTASSIVKISPAGAVSTFLSGYILGTGLAIDNQDNLYSYATASASTVLKISPNATVTQLATLGGVIKAMAIGPDEQLYVVDASNALSRIHPDGQVELVTRSGISNARGLTIDVNGYFYILTANSGTHVDEDGKSRTYSKILRISPDGKRYSDYHTQANFEFEGVNVTADCSNNLLFAPTADYPFKSAGEENTLLQVVGDTGEERQVLYGPSIDPALSDMDVLFYDRFGKRLLIWTDLNQGKIFSFPVICGGIDADVHLITRSDVAVSEIDPAPNQSTDLGNGTFEHIWNLTQVDNRGLNLQLGLLLEGMAENETRPVAQESYVEFHNSFVPGQKIRTPLAIPTVLATASMQLQPSLDNSQYSALSPVNIQVGISNGGLQAFTGVLQLGIVDAAGFPVQALPPIAVNGQAGLASQSYPALWNTGLFLAGDYKLMAKLFDENGIQVASGSTPFAIAHEANTPASDGNLSLDKSVYAAWDTVDITARLENTSSNVILAPTRVEITVTTPDGQMLLNESAALGELVPNALRDLAFTLSLADAASGHYPVLMVVKDAASGATLLIRSAVFSVERQAIQSILGTVAASPLQVQQGEPVSCAEQAENRSASPITGVLLTSELVSADSQQTLSTTSRTVDLAANTTLSEVHSIVTSSLPPGAYACVLLANVGGQSVQLGAALFDVLEPPINIEGSFEPGKHGRLIVLVDPLDEKCRIGEDDDEHKDDESDGHDDDKDGKSSQSHQSDSVHNDSEGQKSGDKDEGHDDDDDHNDCDKKACQTQQAERDYLDALLQTSDWSYTVVDTAKDFTKALRSGTYTAYSLLSARVKLDESVQKELREAVNRGEGLVEAGGSDQRQGRIDGVLGLKFNGTYPRMTGVNINADGFTPQGQLPLQLTDETLRFTLDGATALGKFIKNGQVTSNLALAEHPYGLGRTIHVGYDLLAEASLPGADSRHGQLLLDALNHVNPKPLLPFAHTAYPLAIKIANTGIATPGWVVFNIPANVAVIDARGATFADNQLMWSFDLANNASADYTVWVKLPEQPVMFNATVESGSGGNYKIQKELALDVETVVNNDLKAALDGIAPLTAKTYKQARSYLQLAETKRLAGNWADSLDALLQAADALIAVNTPAAAQIRLSADRALRSVSIKLAAALTLKEPKGQ